MVVEKNALSSNNTDLNDKIFTDPQIFQAFLTKDEKWIFNYILHNKDASTVNEIYSQYLVEIIESQNHIEVFAMIENPNFNRLLAERSPYYEIKPFIRDQLIKIINEREYRQAFKDGFIQIDNKKISNDGFTFVKTKDFSINKRGDQVKEYESALRRNGIRFTSYMTFKKAVLNLESLGVLRCRTEGKKNLYFLSPNWLIKYKKFYE